MRDEAYVQACEELRDIGGTRDKPILVDDLPALIDTSAPSKPKATDAKDGDGGGKEGQSIALERGSREEEGGGGAKGPASGGEAGDEAGEREVTADSMPGTRTRMISQSGHVSTPSITGVTAEEEHSEVEKGGVNGVGTMDSAGPPPSALPTNEAEQGRQRSQRQNNKRGVDELLEGGQDDIEQGANEGDNDRGEPLRMPNESGEGDAEWEDKQPRRPRGRPKGAKGKKRSEAGKKEKANRRGGTPVKDTPPIAAWVDLFGGGVNEASEVVEKSAPGIIHLMWAHFGGPDVTGPEYSAKIQSILDIIVGSSASTQLRPFPSRPTAADLCIGIGQARLTMVQATFLQLWQCLQLAINVDA